MKKGFLLLLGLAALITIALIPATFFAVASNGTTKPHPIHIFPHKGHTRQGAKVAKAASATGSNKVPYNGGPVMTGTMNVYAIFWEPTSNVSANYNGLIKRYFNDVGGSPLYKINNQYTQTGGASPSNAVLAGSWVDTIAYPNSPLLDSNIQNEVTRAQSQNSWSSGIDNIFFVFTERNENICADSTQTQCATNTFCAYHSYFGTNTIYATMPYAASFSCNPGASPNNDEADQTINVTSHEQMEAATDPLLSAWVDTTNPNGGEIGDLCAWTFGPGNFQGADVLWNKDPYIAQQEWSNAISGCTLTTNNATRYYQIVNRNSGLVMDVSGGGTNAGAQVIQWTNHNGLNQQWKLVPDGAFFQIVNRNSGLVLDVYGGGTTQGVNVIQWTNHNGLNQQWSLIPTSA
jgi:hypothetical protein